MTIVIEVEVYVISKQSKLKIKACVTLTDSPTKHKAQHIGEQMHTKFYEKDFEATSIEELEFVRSPFYDLAAL